MHNIIYYSSTTRIIIKYFRARTVGSIRVHTCYAYMHTYVLWKIVLCTRTVLAITDLYICILASTSSYITYCMHKTNK